jgi:hypothetical protein
MKMGGWVSSVLRKPFGLPNRMIGPLSPLLGTPVMLVSVPSCLPCSGLMLLLGGVVVL